MTFQISNPLGNMGHSNQGLGNLTAGLENLQRVEMQRRLAEINQNKEWERDDRLRNEKLTLEMSSVPTANFVTNFEMDKFAKGKDDYTNFLTGKRRLRNGKLTTDDWIEISQKRSELVDQTVRGKAFRDSFDKYQSSVISVRSKLKDPEEIAKFDEQQAVFAKKIADPKYEPNPYDAIEALQAPDEPSYKTYEDFDKQLKSAAVNVDNPNTFKEIIAAQSEPRKRALLEIGKEAGYYTDEKGLVDFFYERNKGLLDRKPVGNGSDLGYGLGRSAIDFEPEVTNIGGRDYNLVNTPSTVPQASRVYSVKGATNLTTGEPVGQLDKAKVVGVDVDQNKIIFESGGGIAKIGDEVALFKEGDTPLFEKGKWENGIAEADINKPSVQKTKLMGAYRKSNPDEKEPEDISNVRVVKTEDGYTLKGDAKVSEWMGLSKKTVPVSVSYKTANDPRPASFYEAPLSENKSAVANWISKVAINGKPMGQYFDEYKKSAPKNQQAQQVTISKQELLGKGYSESQISQFVKEGKVKLK